MSVGVEEKERKEPRGVAQNPKAGETGPRADRERPRALAGGRSREGAGRGCAQGLSPVPSDSGLRFGLFPLPRPFNGSLWEGRTEPGFPFVSTRAHDRGVGGPPTSPASWANSLLNPSSMLSSSTSIWKVTQGVRDDGSDRVSARCVFWGSALPHPGPSPPPLSLSHSPGSAP